MLNQRWMRLLALLLGLSLIAAACGDDDDTATDTTDDTSEETSEGPDPEVEPLC